MIDYHQQNDKDTTTNTNKNYTTTTTTTTTAAAAAAAAAAATNNNAKCLLFMIHSVCKVKLRDVMLLLCYKFNQSDLHYDRQTQGQFYDILSTLWNLTCGKKP